MLKDFPKPPSETFFEVQKIGLGWLRVCLIDEQNEKIILSRTVPRPDMSMFNISSTPVSFIKEIGNYEVSQPSDIKATARNLIKDYEQLPNLNSELIELIQKVDDINDQDYIGKYL